MDLNWNLCIICQESTAEPLKCPLHNPIAHGDQAGPYESFLANVNQFRMVNALPTPIFFDPNESAATFVAHTASWHKSCYLKYNNSKLTKARKRSASTSELNPEKKRSKRQGISVDNCIFCEKGCDEGSLHQVLTFDADNNIRAMVAVLQDTHLLAKISDIGDLIAREAKYHLKCLVNLRNRYRSHVRKSSQLAQDADEKLNESRAFVELTSYIEKAVDAGTLLFQLSDLHSMYINRLEDFGINKQINKTRLKSNVLEKFPEAQEQHDGKNTIIVFEEGMKNMLKEALKKRDFSEDVAILAKTATIVRNDIFNHDHFTFTGSFPPNCQEESLPSSLKSLVSLILNGPNLQDQDRQESQACLTISQLILYNVKKRSSKLDAKPRHTLQREPPLPVYFGLNVHQVTRSKKLIQQLYQTGICISYDRVLELEEWIATAVCEQFEKEGVVAPACLRKGLFTVGALDNLDHNPSSTTSVNSFHGTGISLFQFPTRDYPGESRQLIAIPPSGNKHSLPDYYACVPAVTLTTSVIVVPSSVYSETEPSQACLDEALVEEASWFHHALPLVEEEVVTNNAIAWAAYHASRQPPIVDPPALCALLPLFYEKSATPAMVKHGMAVQKQAIEYLNPGQIPVTTFDQPLFALAKFIQWKWPDTYGEQKYVVMLGGLHTEMALWNTLGDVLESSGWTAALTEAEVATSGIASSFLKVTHLTRTRHAHQITLLALKKLQHEAFLLSASNESEQVWVETMCKLSPTFMYWDFILRQETLILVFIRAHREKNFALYVEVLEKLTPLFFALDHVNYSRWMPVHIQDMKSLPNPIKEEFEGQSHWVLSKTNNTFSSIPIDQAHEQENAHVKGSGGCIGLTENPVAFRRWMLSGPELVRLQQQFEDEYLVDNDPDNPRNFRNHEQGLAAQKTFQQQVYSLCKVFQKMGNPFLDNFPELVTLDSRTCTNDSVVTSLSTLEETGNKQYQDFVRKVLLDRTDSIHSPIKKNSLALFKRPQLKVKSKQGRKMKILENNVALFGQLYISMHSRDGDLKEFFAHEVQPFPPSLSDLGKLYIPNTKSDLLKCIEQSQQTEPPSTYDCTILDGAAIVHSLPTAGVKTFIEYANDVFIPYLSKQLRVATRLDVVWDTYIPNSLKESTRDKRGKGVRRKVSALTKLPTNWMDFLRDPKNKEELFSFLTSRVIEFECPSNKSIYITSGASVESRGERCCQMSTCSHEEADTRIAVHILHALEQGMKIIQVRTVDTDVVTILVGAYFNLVMTQPEVDIWVAFGMGKHFRFFSINAICSNLGEAKSRALPVFHAMTGCDTVSAFKGKGKKSAWQAWQAYEHITDTFVYLAGHPFEHLDANSDHFKEIEQLIVIMYDRTSHLSKVNEAREEIFCQKSQSVDKMPPTQDALLQHTHRALYQAGIWTTCTQAQPTIPSPEEFGWTIDSGRWVPVWITLPEVSRACSELIKCSCKGSCTRCKCVKANLNCSPLCTCKCNDNSDLDS